MKRWLAVPFLGLLAAGGFIASTALTAAGDVICNSATATATTPDHIIGVDGSPVSTVPGASNSAVATACITEPIASTVTVTVGTSPPPPPPPPPPADITIGETALLATTDNANANLLMGQTATLGQQAMLKSLSFNVATATGNLRLGLYGNAAGQPGALLASTDSFAAVSGWNTQTVTTQPTLDAGTYWLVYLPSSNGLSFRKATDSSSTGRYASFAFAPMPATYPSPSTAVPQHRSFYATLTPTGIAPPPPPPPPPPVTEFSGPFNCYGVDTSGSCYSLGGP